MATNEIKLKVLSNEAVRCILEEHERFKASSGKQGRLADLSVYCIEDFDFSGLELSSIKACASVFVRCCFVGCDLSGSCFNDSKFIAANFRNSYLWKAEFYNVEAKDAQFDNVDAGSAEFDQTNLVGATFRGANLRGASIIDCDLTNAIFDGADLENASVVNNIGSGTSWKNVKGRSVAA